MAMTRGSDLAITSTAALSSEFVSGCTPSSCAGCPGQRVHGQMAASKGRVVSQDYTVENRGKQVAFPSAPLLTGAHATCTRASQLPQTCGEAGKATPYAHLVKTQGSEWSVGLRVLSNGLQVAYRRPGNDAWRLSLQLHNCLCSCVEPTGQQQAISRGVTEHKVIRQSYRAEGAGALHRRTLIQPAGKCTSPHDKQGGVCALGAAASLTVESGVRDLHVNIH